MCAWKTYTQFGPGGKGFFLSDDVGIRFIEKARALGVKVICVHKGLPFGQQSYEHSQCSDIGVVAKRFPDVELPRLSLRVRHRPPRASSSGRYAERREPRRHRHADPLAGGERRQAPNRNVYAELGQHVALPHARPGAGGARAREALQVLRRGQRALGHRLDLVRLAAGPDPGVPHVPDLARAAREARLSRDHAGAAREGLRAERDPVVPGERGGGEEATRGATASRASGSPTASAPSRTSSPTGRRRAGSS